ncbi:hypothetical protein HGRIS_001333 [Hohenbuehelia grisea]|uniref:Uncharacterized protein n=1 Tax=Hohenbuehelia grisea TaxID=104357 RepID=A0ABR3JPT5_9AGAR
MYAIQTTIPNPRVPSCFWYISAWSQLAAAHIVLGIQGNPEYVVSLLQYLALGESPLQGCTINVEESPSWFTNVIIPEKELTLGQLRSPPRNDGRIELPSLIIFGVDARQHEGLIRLFNSLSLPSLHSNISLGYSRVEEAPHPNIWRRFPISFDGHSFILFSPIYQL